MQKTICDFCGQDAEPNPALLHQTDISIFRYDKRYDICDDCKNALKDWIEKRSRNKEDINDSEEDNIKDNKKCIDCAYCYSSAAVVMCPNCIFHNNFKPKEEKDKE